jgi:hypothetical protein
VECSTQSFIRFQGLTTASMKMTAFWNIVLCGLTEVYKHFRGAYCLHHCPWRQYASLKHWSTYTILHSAISKKAVIFTLDHMAEFLERIVICTCADINICLVLCVQLTQVVATSGCTALLTSWNSFNII